MKKYTAEQIKEAEDKIAQYLDTCPLRNKIVKAVSFGYTMCPLEYEAVYIAIEGKDISAEEADDLWDDLNMLEMEEIEVPVTTVFLTVLETESNVRLIFPIERGRK